MRRSTVATGDETINRSHWRQDNQQEPLLVETRRSTGATGGATGRDDDRQEPLEPLDETIDRRQEPLPGDETINRSHWRRSTGATGDNN